MRQGFILGIFRRKMSDLGRNNIGIRINEMHLLPCLE
jgi:hypothetical protein